MDSAIKIRTKKLVHFMGKNTCEKNSARLVNVLVHAIKEKSFTGI